ncbi:hypothetical protein SARC_11808 [Sphaeroforma arctica JP610]|uniref:HTH OST-type domain-containing protein n=1 Tax=Sphaeroforma arctica JP610 TaxID=667725 RepID=A0A0L0FFX0_9EUKA|nr:hypothetical protein SARC_11808 [Sphaeroforma arctica JP610]KNC75672.1 hypothetical protein SARC_11808 [Sphaeroforma arctica JP610]|eukprot:XP_014149574.1 hypothetical protein SARC_11808 [Sphaeroforma arctica JP610]
MFRILLRETGPGGCILSGVKTKWKEIFLKSLDQVQYGYKLKEFLLKFPDVLQIVLKGKQQWVVPTGSVAAAPVAYSRSSSTASTSATKRSTTDRQNSFSIASVKRARQEDYRPSAGMVGVGQPTDQMLDGTTRAALTAKLMGGDGAKLAEEERLKSLQLKWEGNKRAKDWFDTPVTTVGAYA